MSRAELPAERIEGEVSVSPTGDVVVGAPAAEAIVVLPEDAE